MPSYSRVLVTGGAGYVGAVLVPRLLEAGYAVRVLDLYLYGDDVLAAIQDHPGLEQVKGDIRDLELLRRTVPGCDAVIHLACISNDPSFELNPALGRSVNYDAFGPLVRIAKESGVRRFIYASTSSVYGVSDRASVDETHPLAPLTDYSRFKALCEPILLEQQSPDFTTVVVRPATVCGYSPRLRLDLTVNILTNHAVNSGKITVFGGTQMRPNIHIDDMADAYLLLLEAPDQQVAGKVFNVGYENHTILQLAEMVREVVSRNTPRAEPIQLVTTSSNDRRSYHICSDRIRHELGFRPGHSITDAVEDLVEAFHSGRVPNALTEPRYYNIRLMQRVQLQ